MANKPYRVVLDTNIFIYFLISDSFTRLEKPLKANSIRLLFSEELIDEFVSVVGRAKFKKYFTQKEITALLDSLQEYADFIEVVSNVNACRDEKDNFLLSLCLDGKADYLITGDDDLLVLRKYKKTRILKISEFLKL